MEKEKLSQSILTVISIDVDKNQKGKKIANSKEPKHSD